MPLSGLLDSPPPEIFGHACPLIGENLVSNVMNFGSYDPPMYMLKGLGGYLSIRVIPFGCSQPFPIQFRSLIPRYLLKIRICYCVELKPLNVPAIHLWTNVTFEYFLIW